MKESCSFENYADKSLKSFRCRDQSGSDWQLSMGMLEGFSGVWEKNLKHVEKEKRRLL